MATVSDDSIERIANLFDRAFDPTTGFYIGFKGKALNQLKDMLLTTLMTVQSASNKVIEELRTENEKNAKLQRQSDKENFNRLNEAIKKVNDEKTDGKLFNEILKNLGEKEKQEVTTIAKLQKTATAVGKIIDGLIAGVTQFKNATDKEAAYASDLRSSGIVIAEAGKNFADSFSGTAARLGISSDKFLEVIKSNGSRIASLGALSAQTNIDIVKQGMSAYNKFKNLNISDARSIMELQMDMMNNSMTSEQIRQLNLEKATSSLVKRFGELSLMTGKSIEQLAKEQEMKDMKTAYDTFAGMNVVADSLMRQMNFKQSWKEYVATGKITDEVAQDMAQNPELRALLTKISNDIVTGKLNNQSDIATFADRYKEDVLGARNAGILHGQWMVANRMGNAPAEWQSSLLAGSGLKIPDTAKLQQYKGSDQSLLNEIMGNTGKLADAASAAIDAMKSGNAAALEKMNKPIDFLNQSTLKTYNLLSGAMEPNGRIQTALVDIKNAIDRWTGGNATGITSAIISGISSAGGTILGLGLMRKFFGGKISAIGMNLLGGKNFFMPTAANTNIPTGGASGGMFGNMLSNFKNASMIDKTKMLGKSGLAAYLAYLVGSSAKSVYDFSTKTPEQWLADERAKDNERGLGMKLLNAPITEFREAFANFGDMLGNGMNGIYKWWNKDKTNKQAEKVKFYSDLAKETGFDFQQILDMQNRNMSVDQIREAGKKIVPETEPKKEAQTTQEATPEKNQTEIVVSDTLATKIELGDKTIDALSKAFIDAFKNSENFLRNINKTFDLNAIQLQENKVSNNGQAFGNG